MTTIGVSPIGVRPPAGTFTRAKPTVTVTSPEGVVAQGVTLSFMYSSPVGRAQYSYRFQVRSPDGLTVLYDTFTVVSSDNTDIAIDYLFAGGSQYRLYVQVSDGFDTSDWAFSNFTADVTDVNDFPDNEQVGSVYEIGINGMGLMLDDNPNAPVRRKLQALQSPRFATGDTPFSEAVERYTFLGQSSFKGGAGQNRLNRPDADPTKFLDSFRVNPFEDDGLQVVPSLSTHFSNSYAEPFLVVVGDRYYVVKDADELHSATVTSGAAFSITGAAAPTSMASDGEYWYWADGANIFRNNTNADPVTAWSTINAIMIRPCLDRMVCTYDNGAGEIVVSTLDDAGAEEVASGRFLYPDTVDIPDLAAGDGYLWFIVNRNNQSQVHFWQVGSADTYAAVGLTLPQGQKATALGYYLGNLMVRAVQDTPAGVGTKASIYRCVPNDGVLTPEKVAEWDNTVDESVGAFCGRDRFVFFSMRSISTLNGNPVAGVGCIDLSTGGWCKWTPTSAVDNGAVRAISVIGNRLVAGTDASGASVESTSPATSTWDVYLTTSIADLGSGLTKVWDDVLVLMDALPADASVALSYTIDGGNSYTDLPLVADTPGQLTLAQDIAVEARSFGLKLTFVSGTTSPLVRMSQVKLHALSLSDHLLQFPVKAADRMDGLNGRALPTNAPGGGINLIRTLESLIGTRVKLQDVDWPINRTSTIWELVDVDTTLTIVFNQKENRNVTSGVATITLRRPS